MATPAAAARAAADEGGAMAAESGHAAGGAGETWRTVDTRGTDTAGSEAGRRTAVVIVTGFLGAGKTTVLNHILSNQDGARVAVLVNEFGAIDIDSQLIDASATVSSSLSLKNGCVCCEVNDDLEGALVELLARRTDSETAPQAYDYILLETSGIADPAPVIYTIVHGRAAEYCFVDSVVTVVNAETYASLAETSTVKSQINCADVVLLNKCDLIDKRAQGRVRDAIAARLGGGSAAAPSDVAVIACEHGKVPVSVLFGATERTGSTKPGGASETAGHGGTASGGAAGPHESHDHAGHHSHGGVASSSHLKDDGFNSRFLCGAVPESVLRIKARIALDSEIDGEDGSSRAAARQLVLHRCGMRYSVVEGKESASRVSEIVLIGRGLDKAALLSSLQNACPGSRVSLPAASAPDGESSAADAFDIERTEARVQQMCKLIEEDVRFKRVPWRGRTGEIAVSLSGILGIGAYVEGERLARMNADLASAFNMSGTGIALPLRSVLHDGSELVAMVFALAACGGSAEWNVSVPQLWKALETAAVPVLTQAFMETMCC